MIVFNILYDISSEELKLNNVDIMLTVLQDEELLANCALVDDHVAGLVVLLLDGLESIKINYNYS